MFSTKSRDPKKYIELGDQNQIIVNLGLLGTAFFVGHWFETVEKGHFSSQEKGNDSNEIKDEQCYYKTWLNKIPWVNKKGDDVYSFHIKHSFQICDCGPKAVKANGKDGKKTTVCLQWLGKTVGYGVEITSDGTGKQEGKLFRSGHKEWTLEINQNHILITRLAWGIFRVVTSPAGAVTEAVNVASEHVASAAISGVISGEAATALTLFLSSSWRKHWR